MTLKLICCFFIPFIHVRVRRQHVHPHPLHVNILNTITSNEFKILKEFVADDDFSEFYEHVKWFGLKKFCCQYEESLL